MIVAIAMLTVLSAQTPYEDCYQATDAEYAAAFGDKDEVSFDQFIRSNAHQLLAQGHDPKMLLVAGFLGSTQRSTEDEAALLEAGWSAVGPHPFLLSTVAENCIKNGQTYSSLCAEPLEQQIIAGAPDNAWTWLNLARLAWMRGDIDAGYAAMQRATEAPGIENPYMSALQLLASVFPNSQGDEEPTNNAQYINMNAVILAVAIPSYTELLQLCQSEPAIGHLRTDKVAICRNALLKLVDSTANIDIEFAHTELAHYDLKRRQQAHIDHRYAEKEKQSRLNFELQCQLSPAQMLEIYDWKFWEAMMYEGELIAVDTAIDSAKQLGITVDLELP
ncbi:MAG: hypothetical protein DHS20C11_01690 [Lysobacteraceae bacterium]|nr:MAG: hypothetical protein DHS20C11_01690 [Xanthomonadaceae bacterium]